MKSITPKEAPEFQEIECVVRLKLYAPTNTEDGSAITEEDYCQNIRDTILYAFSGQLAGQQNSADACDILELRQEAEIYHSTQAQAWDRLNARVADMRDALDM